MPQKSWFRLVFISGLLSATIPLLAALPAFGQVPPPRSFERELTAIEPQVEALKSELSALLEGITSKSTKQQLTDVYRERIYALYVSITEFLSIPRNVGPSKIFSLIHAHDVGTPEDIRELNSVIVCPIANLKACLNTTAFGEKGSIPREVSEPSGYFLLKAMPEAESELMMIDAHHHPVNSTGALYAPGNAAKNPVIPVTHPERFLSGPSSFDCLNFQARTQAPYKRLMSAAVILDRGGIWLCKADWPRDLFDSSKTKQHLKTRAKLVKASQTLTGVELAKAIQSYTREMETIFGSQKLKIRFLEHGASDEYILRIVSELQAH